MNERQKNLLNHIVEDYILTAQPVGSDYLVDKFKLKISAATVRNDCQVLEKDGYLTHPHTSAGRIPTEKGYRHYLQGPGYQKKSPTGLASVMKKESRLLASLNQRLLNNKVDERNRAKSLAKFLAGLARSAVLIGFDKRDVYYTGLAYLFAQPEFQNLDLIYNLGTVVDTLDEVFPQAYDEFDQDVKVKIGSENLFSSDCSFVGSKLKLGDDEGLFGILGPLRMDYFGNIGRVEYVRQLLSA